MGIEEYKITGFKKPVSALADTPQMGAEALKAWFDSNSTDELKTSVNGIIDSVLADEAALAGKVDKEAGKGLSANDYTDAEKAKAHTHANASVLAATTAAYTTAEKTKLSGVAAGANNYVHPASHSADMISTTASKRFTSDAEMEQKASKSYVDGALSDKADGAAVYAALEAKADAQNSSGGFAGGDGASAGTGGAAGEAAYTGSGGAVGSLTFGYSGGAVGQEAMEENGGGAVGCGAHAAGGGAIGNYAVAGAGFAGGDNAKAADDNGNGIDAIQLGTGTNSAPKTLQVYEHQLLDASGKIPDGRLPTQSSKLIQTVQLNIDSSGNDVTDLDSLPNGLAQVPYYDGPGAGGYLVFTAVDMGTYGHQIKIDAEGVKIRYRSNGGWGAWNPATP